MIWPFQRATPDPAAVVQSRLNRIERQNESAVAWDHRFAFVLILTIALAALLGMASESIAAILAGHIQGVAVVNLAVAFLFVLGMNRGLLAAARNIRRKQGRREPAEMADLATMWGVAAIESLSLGYMLWLFEHPAALVPWTLIVLRAGVVPLATIYLEIQRVQPIDPQDIGIQVEIAAGLAVLRHVATVAADRSVALPAKIGMYRAAADLTAHQAAKLDAMRDAAEGYHAPPASSAAAATASDGDGVPAADEAPPPERPPTGPGTPTRRQAKTKTKHGQGTKRRNVTPIRPSVDEAGAIRARRLDTIAALMAADPQVSVRAIIAQLRSAGDSKVSGSTVAALRRQASAWQGEAVAR